MYVEQCVSVQVRLAVASPARRTSHVSSKELNDMYTCYPIYMFDALYEMLPNLLASSNVMYATNGAVPTISSANAKLRYSVCPDLHRQCPTKKALT